ncbi:MAG: putative transporter [Bacteroidales bacterium]|nr:putative transporter [Bacteroidales bacterium]MDD6781714.1 putative transporter [Bacteroidales bacterium]
MDFLSNLFFAPSITQSLFVLTLTIALGIFLGAKLKIRSMSLGVTWILFCGIVLSAFGIRLTPEVESFAKDFGLVLFVYSIGLSVGPSFFSSLGKGGLRLNLVAVGVVLLTVCCTVAIHFITGEDMATLVGVMSGAVTNTPSLGAAQQTFGDMHGAVNPNIANGYAVAYPLGVVGIILSFMILRWVFRINLHHEEEALHQTENNGKEPVCVDVAISNNQIDGVAIAELNRLCRISLVVSRIIHADKTESVPTAATRLHVGDTIRVLTEKEDLPTLMLLGQLVENQHNTTTRSKASNLVSRRIVVTKPEWNGQKIGKMNLTSQYRVTITRVNRAGIDLLARPNLHLQLGDRIMVVGETNDVQKVADIFGNELKRLDVPNLMPIFIGIALGVVLGTLPIAIPGVSQSFKLGLAGGSLIVALLISYFGPYKMVIFTTSSANMMLREIGISLFLAAVGLGAGASFVPSIVAGGYMWLVYGIVITLVPILIMEIVARKVLHLNYFTIMGLIAGSTTDPPALAYASELSTGNDQASVAYATVYPLTMFLRVLVAQLMILALC